MTMISNPNSDLLYLCITKNDQLFSIVSFFTTGKNLYQIISSNYFKLNCHINKESDKETIVIDYPKKDAEYKIYISFQSPKYKYIIAKPELTSAFINERAFLIDFNTADLFYSTTGYKTPGIPKAVIYKIPDKFKITFSICNYADIGKSGLVIDCPLVEFFY